MYLYFFASELRLVDLFGQMCGLEIAFLHLPDVNNLHSSKHLLMNSLQGPKYFMFSQVPNITNLHFMVSLSSIFLDICHLSEVGEH